MSPTKGYRCNKSCSDALIKHPGAWRCQSGSMFETPKNCCSSFLVACVKLPLPAVRGLFWRFWMGLRNDGLFYALDCIGCLASSTIGLSWPCPPRAGLPRMDHELTPCYTRRVFHALRPQHCQILAGVCYDLLSRREYLSASAITLPLKSNGSNDGRSTIDPPAVDW